MTRYRYTVEKIRERPERHWVRGHWRGGDEAPYDYDVEEDDYNESYESGETDDILGTLSMWGIIIITAFVIINSLVSSLHHPSTEATYMGRSYTGTSCLYTGIHIYININNTGTVVRTCCEWCLYQS